ncbi:Regulator of V-ATPase in vacuolar membrane protein 1 [Cyberlindnera fabianii]|uniref:Regulator of V-ATPase in vacuolar membrane protein 1 n=1 Tax=Cyberlindnera fabianii TaxID=36022 RepID=A0A1V2L635_CYBFA|nr:Regulator of V-ATPase in vacuolar membrane protein 1 [Cyberlindnera fabianii]
MSVSFVPGEPSKHPQTVAQAQWHGHAVAAYCSGNNLIVLDGMTNLQTLYLDSDACAVDINPHNGAIAVAVGSQVLIYEPMHEFMAVPRWQFSTRLVHPADHSPVSTLSWGRHDEIVTGSDFLTLWEVRREYGVIQVAVRWTKKQATPVYLAKLSQDSQLIASCGRYDRLLKVWHSNASGENPYFALTYLLHPDYVTDIRWKRYDPEHMPTTGSFTNALYSICKDEHLRIWSSHEHENNHMVQLWGSLDLSDHDCEDGHDKTGKEQQKKKKRKFVFILDNYIISQSLTRLHEVQNKPLPPHVHSDLALVFSEDGHHTSYALDNVSLNPPRLINISKIKDITFRQSAFVRTPQFLHFAEPLVDKDTGEISMLIHDLNGCIKHSKIDVSFLLEDTKDTQIAYLSHKFTGHTKSIQRIDRTSNGEAMLTCSRFEENAVWIPQYLKDSVTLKKKSIVRTPCPISKAVLFHQGDMLLTICAESLILWDTSIRIASELARIEIDSVTSSPECFAVIPLEKHRDDKHYVMAIYKDQTRAWAVEGKTISEAKIENLPVKDDEVHLIAAIDPVGTVHTSERAILSVIDKKGYLRRFSAKIVGDEVKWTEATPMYSNIANASYIRGSSISKFAIVDESKQRLTIWDLNRGVLEYEEEFDEPVRDIDWTSTENKQSILAVGFLNHSLLYTQLRYDYTNKTPAFLAIKKIDIQSYTTHAIGDSVWLKDGILVVGAGNQIFISDKNLDMNDKFTKYSIGSRNIVSNDILTLCAVLNGVLPLYHPQLLIQSLFNGKIELVKEILLRLFLKIRELELAGETIEKLGSTLGFDTTKFSEKTFVKSHDFEEPYTEFNDNVCDLLKEKLLNHSLPYLTRHQQITLMSTVEAVIDINQNFTTFDQNGLRFYLGAKLFQLHKESQDALTMRDINWAMHSENKEMLLQLVETSVKERKVLWSTAKEYGLAYWLKYDDLVRTMESVARNEFTNQETRDPSKCAIYYLALKKKQILHGLWRTAIGNPEQSKMLNFLKNDFKEDRWRKAALKNAFVLLSKHRYMDAACFFLLGNSLKDAVNVLIRQIDDIDLAIAVCRVHEGDNGPVLKDLLQKHLLSRAVLSGDRWTTSYIFWKLRQQSRSIQALVKSPIEAITEEEKVNIVMTDKAKSFLEDDPLLIVLYENLREKNLNYFHGSLKITPQEETEFILRVASIYTRMGCDYLSADLVKNWTFLRVDDIKKEQSELHLKKLAQSGTGNLLEKYGFSPNARRRASFISDYKAQKDDDSEVVVPSSSNNLNGNGTHADISNEKGYPNGNGNGNSENLSILERYGLASHAKTREEEKKEEEEKKKKTANYTPPPQTAFQEPDMSAFNFGF